MDRRLFMKKLLATGIAASTYVPGTPLGISRALANHSGGTTPTLVVIFQRGGCDGLNTVVPYGEAEYYNLRNTIGIAAPDASNPNSAIPINDSARGFTDFFGLNPNMASLLPLYNAGDLAVMPAVQYPNSSHSHFSGQDFIESAIPFQIADNGWLYRQLETLGISNGLEAISFGNELAKSLRGQTSLLSITYLNDFSFPTAAGDIQGRLNQHVLPLYNNIPSPASDNQLLVHNTGQLMFSNLDSLSSIDTESLPENGAVYPNTSYGRRMRETALLIKQNLGVQVVTVNIGGYDTHSEQGGAEPTGAHSRRIREFSDGIAALYTDLGDTRMQDVIILSMTEFGRTAKENGSAGTDHGDASAWFMVGKNINGGIHGAWPGLSDTELANGRYLRYTMDYRDIYGEVLLNHMGHSTSDLATLLPTHSYTPLGLFS